MRTGQVTTLMVILSLVMLSFLAGCSRNRPARKPPIHLNPNMDNQEKYKAQSESKFFADGSTMRIPVDGTVARGELFDDPIYNTGKLPNGKFVKKVPVEVDYDLIKRGQERFNIFCAPCHSRLGDGQGLLIKKGYIPPPTFHQDRIRQITDGEMFGIISNGVRNMPSYSSQVPVEDRWAIITFLRALQRSHNADLSDIPADQREALEKAENDSKEQESKVEGEAVK